MIVAYLTAITTLISGVIFTLLYTRHNRRFQMASKVTTLGHLTGMTVNQETIRTVAINTCIVVVVWHAMFVAWFTLWQGLL